MAKTSIGMDVSLIETALAHNGRTYYDVMPSNLVDRSGIVSPESFAQYLKNLKKESGISGSDFALALPQSDTYFRTMTSPVMTDEQIKLNLPYEFRNFVGQDAIQYNYDYIVDSVENDEEGKPVSFKLLAAAGSKEKINEFARAIKRAGFRLKAALPHEVCLINLMKKTAEADKEYCLIGVGYDYTNVYMFKGAELSGSKKIELGCHDIDAVIALEHNVDEFLASTYRDKNHKDCLSMPSLNDTYDRIALEVMKTINFYRYEHNETEIDTAYFYSLGANNEKLIGAICEHTNFKEGNIKELLPKEYAEDENAARCLISIAAAL